jgi:hypothetical protein
MLQELLSIHKIETSGMNFFSKFTESESLAYSEWQIKKFTQSSFDASIVSKYTRKRLMSIMMFIYQSMDHVRFGVDDAQARLISDLFFLISCDKLDDKNRVSMMSIFSK